MPRGERVERHAPMLRYLTNYTATDWARSFMKQLAGSRSSGSLRSTMDLVPGERLPAAVASTLHGRSALVFTDYDGTLVPIAQTPESAVLDAKVRGALKTLTRARGLRLVAVSGRPGKFMMQELASLGIPMGSEHGGKYYDPRRGRWQSLVLSDTGRWYREAALLMEDYCRRVPGSRIEKKEFSISWHFRQSPEEFSEYESKKLREELETGLSNFPVTAITGKKVIEVRATEANKGRFVRWYLENGVELNGSAIIAIGDDETDEDMFRALPEDAVTIKVGPGATRARYRVAEQKDVLPLLQRLAGLAGES
jgi:trehalose 6-phosphate synthase/phosphatase